MFDDNRNAALEGFLIGTLIFYLIALAFNLLLLLARLLIWFVPWFVSELRRYTRMFCRWNESRRYRANLRQQKKKIAEEKAFLLLCAKVEQERMEAAAALSEATGVKMSFDRNAFYRQFCADYGHLSHRQVKRHLNRLYGVRTEQQIRHLYNGAFPNQPRPQ